MCAYKDYSFEEVSKLDNALFQLASYDVTQGLLVVPETLEGESNLARKTMSRFNYLKKLIQSGECTYEFIKNHILAKNGPFYHEELHKSIDEQVNDVIKASEETSEELNSQSDEVNGRSNARIEDLLYKMELMSRCVKNQKMLEDAIDIMNQMQKGQDKTGFKKFDAPEDPTTKDEGENDDKDRGGPADNQ